MTNTNIYMWIGFSVVAVFIACFSYAVDCGGECVAGSAGIVRCSKYPNGGAAAGSAGIVYCGKGKCVADFAGIVRCSKIKGGGAAAGSAGIVKCQGGCESGSSSMCE